MPELFIRCPTCDGVGVILNEEEKEWLDCPALCKRGFVRYGTEPGHQHQWETEVTSWKFEGVEWVAPFAEEGAHSGQIASHGVFCACGKTAAEVV